MAVLYGPGFRDAWIRALQLPGTKDLFDSLALEIAEFLGLSVDEAKSRMERAWLDRAELARISLPKGRESGAVRGYYVSQEHGLYVGAYWHALLPDSWALHSVAALRDCIQFAEGKRVLEFGHGIGSTGLLFAAHGFRMTMGDIGKVYRDFARYRFRRRGVEADFVDLTSLPKSAPAFDVAVTLDVLEHIPQPMTEIRWLHSMLKPGGLLVMNIVFGRDPSNPEHLLFWRLGTLDRIRGVGLERLPSTLLTYYKRPLGLSRRVLYRLQDVVEAASLDLATRGAPLLWRLTHIMVPPDRPW